MRADRVGIPVAVAWISVAGVAVAPGDFSQLALGNSVQKDSSFLMGHAHVVIIGCLV